MWQYIIPAISAIVVNDYLYAPYEKMGGNGSAKRMMEEVRRLPIRK